VQGSQPLETIPHKRDLQLRASLLVGGIAIAILIAAAPMAGGILGAIVIAVLLESPYKKLSSKIGPNHAAALLLVGCLLAILIPAFVIGHLAWSQAQSFDPAIVSDIQVPREWDDYAIGRAVAANIGPITARLASSIGTVASWLAGSAASGAVNVTVMFLCLYFALRSGGEYWSRVRTYLPFSSESTDTLGEKLTRVTQAIVLGTLTSAGLQGASVAVGFALAGLPMPIVWGIVGAFASMLPVLGTAVVWLPAVIFALIRNDFGAVAFIVFFGWFLPSGIDQAARAIVGRRVGNVHPLTTLLGALLGIRIFGVVGLVIGPLLVATFIELLNLYEREYRSIER